MRLDKYLKVSRLIKRRTVANEACDSERVSVNGRAGADLRRRLYPVICQNRRATPVLTAGAGTYSDSAVRLRSGALSKATWRSGPVSWPFT